MQIARCRQLQRKTPAFGARVNPKEEKVTNLSLSESETFGGRGVLECCQGRGRQRLHALGCTGQPWCVCSLVSPFPPDTA